MSPVSGRGGSRAPARWPTKASTCHATYTFDDGQITVAGVPDFSQDAETFQLPVTGGSEAYEGASGQVSVRENGNAEKMTLLLAERD
jgi:hypothetical protein